jgi:hypothetical protein
MNILLQHDLLYLQRRSCYFHWLQAIRRNLTQHHLTTIGKFAAFIHSVYALPYVPDPDVI